jgi:hypothetical protein
MITKNKLKNHKKTQKIYKKKRGGSRWDDVRRTFGLNKTVVESEPQSKLTTKNSPYYKSNTSINIEDYKEIWTYETDKIRIGIIKFLLFKIKVIEGKHTIELNKLDIRFIYILCWLFNMYLNFNIVYFKLKSNNFEDEEFVKSYYLNRMHDFQYGTSTGDSKDPDFMYNIILNTIRTSKDTQIFKTYESYISENIFKLDKNIYINFNKNNLTTEKWIQNNKHLILTSGIFNEKQNELFFTNIIPKYFDIDDDEFKIKAKYDKPLFKNGCLRILIKNEFYERQESLYRQYKHNLDGSQSIENSREGCIPDTPDRNDILPAGRNLFVNYKPKQPKTKEEIDKLLEDNAYDIRVGKSYEPYKPNEPIKNKERITHYLWLLNTEMWYELRTYLLSDKPDNPIDEFVKQKIQIFLCYVYNKIKTEGGNTVIHSVDLTDSGMIYFSLKMLKWLDNTKSLSQSSDKSIYDKLDKNIYTDEDIIKIMHQFGVELIKAKLFNCRIFGYFTYNKYKFILINIILKNVVPESINLQDFEVDFDNIVQYFYLYYDEQRERKKFVKCSKYIINKFPEFKDIIEKNKLPKYSEKYRDIFGGDNKNRHGYGSTTPFAFNVAWLNDGKLTEENYINSSIMDFNDLVDISEIKKSEPLIIIGESPKYSNKNNFVSMLFKYKIKRVIMLSSIFDRIDNTHYDYTPDQILSNFEAFVEIKNEQNSLSFQNYIRTFVKNIPESKQQELIKNKFIPAYNKFNYIVFPILIYNSQSTQQQPLQTHRKLPPNPKTHTSSETMNRRRLIPNPTQKKSGYIKIERSNEQIIKHYWYYDEFDNPTSIENFRTFLNEIYEDINKNIQTNNIAGNTVIHNTTGTNESGIMYICLRMLKWLNEKNQMNLKEFIEYIPPRKTFFSLTKQKYSPEDINKYKELIINKIYNEILIARKFRPFIINTFEQYKFIFNVICKNQQFPEKEKLNDLRDYFKSVLEISMPVNTANLYGSDAKLKNINDIIPYKFNIPWLNNNMENNDNYINASIMDYNDKYNVMYPNLQDVIDNSNPLIIISQCPKENTKDYFIYMLYKYNIKRIIMLNNLGEPCIDYTERRTIQKIDNTKYNSQIIRFTKIPKLKTYDELYESDGNYQQDKQYPRFPTALLKN